MENYFVSDLESGKLNIYTTKEFYAGLDHAQKKSISRFCLFSRSKGCWVSKGQYNRVQHLISNLIAIGFENRGHVGEHISFAEKLERQQERAEARAERAEARAEKADKRSEQYYLSSKEMASVIPMGQPILVGHHSEAKDRRYREKIWNTMGKSVGEQEKADYYRRKAATARETATGDKYNDPGFLHRRIKEAESYLRKAKRYREGKFYRGSQKRELSEKEINHFDGLIAAKSEELAFYMHCLETCGKTVWNKEMLKDKTEVLLRGRWRGLVRANAKTVSVLNTCFDDPQAQRKWPLKYVYGEVEDAR